MATQTGRTVSKHVTFKCDDSGGTLRTVTGVKSINGVGLNYDEIDVTAFADALKNFLPGHADFSMDVTGELDSTADTGFHIVFSGVVGVATPLSFDTQFGMRHAWESGEPQFGMTSSATSGVICTAYTVSPDATEATATLRVMGGTAPAWGTTAET